MLFKIQSIYNFNLYPNFQQLNYCINQSTFLYLGLIKEKKKLFFATHNMKD